MRDHVVSQECPHDVEESHRDDKGWVWRVKHGSSDAEPPRTDAVRIINNMDQMRAETEDRGMSDEVTGDVQVGNGEEVEIFFRKMPNIGHRM